MSRLIDADKLIEQIWKLRKETEEQYDLCIDELKDVYCGVVSLIDAQPTAYDVGNVVGNLEDHAIEFEAFGICSDYVEISHAIEIVKRGGLDE